MTYMAFLCELAICQPGRLAGTGVADVTYALRRHISGARGTTSRSNWPPSARATR